MPIMVKKAPPEELFSQLAQLETEAVRRKFLTRHGAIVRSEVVERLVEIGC